MRFSGIQFAASAQFLGKSDVNQLKNQGLRTHQGLGMVLKAGVGVVAVLASTAALATPSGTAAPAIRAAQPIVQAVDDQAGAPHGAREITAFNDVGVAFATRARITDRGQSAATGLPDLDNWMLLAAGGVLILMVTQRRMRNVND